MKEKIQRLRALAQAMHDRMTPTVWNQLLGDRGMFQDDYMIQCCAPRTILDLLDRIEKLEADRAVLLDCVKFYAAPMEFTHSVDGWIKVRYFGVSDAFVDYFKPARDALEKVGE